MRSSLIRILLSASVGAALTVAAAVALSIGLDLGGLNHLAPVAFPTLMGISLVVLRKIDGVSQRLGFERVLALLLASSLPLGIVSGVGAFIAQNAYAGSFAVGAERNSISGGAYFGLFFLAINMVLAVFFAFTHRNEGTQQSRAAGKRAQRWRAWAAEPADTAERERRGAFLGSGAWMAGGAAAALAMGWTAEDLHLSTSSRSDDSDVSPSGNEFSGIDIGGHALQSDDFFSSGSSMHETTWVNPATGLPMIGGMGGVDAGGSTWGNDNMHMHDGMGHDMFADHGLGTHDMFANNDMFTNNDMFGSHDISSSNDMFS